MDEQIPISQEVPDDLRISGHAISYLKQTSKWALFISIIGFIFIGLCLIGSVFFWLFLTPLSETPVPVPLFSFFYIAIAIIYFFPIYYLYQFSNNIKKALSNNASINLEQAFSCLKSHYKFLGIIIISSIGFYLLFFMGISIFGKYI